MQIYARELILASAKEPLRGMKNDPEVHLRFVARAFDQGSCSAWLNNIQYIYICIYFFLLFHACVKFFDVRSDFDRLLRAREGREGGG